jgi:hypothetical protein
MVQVFVLAALCWGTVAVGTVSASTATAASVHPQSCSDNSSSSAIGTGGCYGGQPNASK